MHKILLVEDEESLARGLQFNLEAEGYQVILASDGEQALSLLKAMDYDLIILDVMLPYHNGFEIAQFVRSKNEQLPILFLTARKTPKDRIKGFKLGADDYLTKPFSLDELLLRVQRILKRKSWYLPPANEPLHIGQWELDVQNLQLISKEKTITLTQLEAHVLGYLLSKRGQVVSRQELLAKVWQTDAQIETRTVDIFIARLRKYLDDDPTNPKWIKSVRGIGYMIP